jgi:hypothetical protein
MSWLRTTTGISLFALSKLLVCSVSFGSTNFSPGVQVGTIANSAITEASGIAASRRNSNVLWVHNDSGDTERVFAMTSTGAHLGTYSISSAFGADWEDIAVGPGPVADTHYLYIGAIGDNNAVRSTISVLRVVEPAVSDTQSPVTVALSGVSRLTFAYPDGPRDAESLFVDPLTRDIYILTKRENPHRLYRAAYPQATSGTTTLEFVTTYSDPNWLTAADISPDGDEIIARATGSTSGRMWLRPPGGTVADALNSAPITIPLASEPQGEAIGFDPLGWGYYTISEGASRPIYYFNRLSTRGDVNEDGVIDAADYVATRKIDDTPAAYDAWREIFGEASTGANAAFSAPEPCPLCGIFAALATITLRRRTRDGVH